MRCKRIDRVDRWILELTWFQRVLLAAIIGVLIHLLYLAPERWLKAI